MRKIAEKAMIALMSVALAVGIVSSPTLANEAYAAAEKTPELSVSSKTVVKGKTFTLKVKNASGKKVKWSSSNKKVATVSRAGKVKARKPGTATITAKVSGKNLKCRVTVVTKPGKPKITKLKYRGGVGGNPYKRKATIKWSKVQGADGYQIAVRWAGFVHYWENGQKQTETSWDSSWATLAYSQKAALSYTLPYEAKYGYTGLKIKIRAYKTINGQKIYGGWSSVKTRMLQ